MAAPEDDAAALRPANASEKQLAYLSDDLSRHLKRFVRKQTYNRTMAALIRVSSIVIAGATTVILGLSGYLTSSREQIAMIALVLSAGLTALTAWETFAEHAWRWTQAHRAVASVHALQDRLEYRRTKEAPITEAYCDELEADLQALLKTEAETWASKRAAAILAAPHEPKRP